MLILELEVRTQRRTFARRFYRVWTGV